MAAISITASGFIPSTYARIREGVAGATITQGQTLYLDSATNTLKLCDADASLAASTCVGIACQSVASGQRLEYVYEDPQCVLGATLVIGDTLWTSATAGGITKTAADNGTGKYTCVLGTAISTTAFNLVIANAGAVTP